ncbi:MAG: type I 3-dehydroquinate dehydratase [Deltaproteobacteria bacterium]|nr:type I 3-dehydroquinate dehydratase [Deltaproteobacteria bacterium]
MTNLKICAVITTEDEKGIATATPLADLFELRIDMIGSGWLKLVKKLSKPWIATNRPISEGGLWNGNEKSRLQELSKAAEMGAAFIDIELRTKRLAVVVERFKRYTRCIISSHNLRTTPPLPHLTKIVEKQIKAGADICKVVTTAVRMEDNFTMLELIRLFPSNTLVSFAMGEEGKLSRLLSPLVGGAFSYASVKTGAESAVGQLSVKQLNRIYEVIDGN